jgi:hypothetical protein
MTEGGNYSRLLFVYDHFAIADNAEDLFTETAVRV